MLAHFIVFYLSMLFRLSHLMRPREMRWLLHSNQLASVNKQLLHGQTSLLSQPQNAKLNWAQIKKYLNKSESILPQTLGHHQPTPKPMPTPSCLFFLFLFFENKNNNARTTTFTTTNPGPIINPLLSPYQAQVFYFILRIKTVMLGPQLLP